MKKVRTFASTTSAWRRSLARSSSTSVVEDSAPASDHVYDRPERSDSPTTSRRVTNITENDTSRRGTATAQPEISRDRPYELGLFALHESGDDARSTASCPVDFIAIHGINGNAYTTWQQKRRERKKGENKKGEGKVGDNKKEKDKEKAFWLRDYLPEEFPGARVYTFGYDARVFFSLATGNIESFAKTLLEDIKAVRTKREVRSMSNKEGGVELISIKEQRRPIIFIAHSMGGLVLKKVSYLADLMEYSLTSVPGFDHRS